MTLVFIILVHLVGRDVSNTLKVCMGILYKYILLVRVICEKYRLRGEANIPCGKGYFTVLETGIFRK
jgi:hypothetical protein